MRQTIYRLGGVLGVDRLFASVNRLRPIVLAFHGVTGETSNCIHNHDGKHLHLPIFRQLMEHVAARYRPVSLGRIVECLEGGDDLPERAVAITFDDGYLNVLTHAAPVLADLGIPATVFVVTDFSFAGKMLWTDRLISALALTRKTGLKVEWGERCAEFPLSTTRDRIAADATIRAAAKSLRDDERLLLIDRVIEGLGVDEARLRSDWGDHRPLRSADLKKLREMNVDVGSHTCSHGIVARLTGERMDAELRDSRRLLEEATGLPCDQFSYPNGAPGDFDARTRERVQGAGYRCAVTTVKRRLSVGEDRFEIPRYLMTHNAITRSEFAAEVSGYPTWFRSAKHRYRRGRSTAGAPRGTSPSTHLSGDTHR